MSKLPVHILLVLLVGRCKAAEDVTANTAKVVQQNNSCETKCPLPQFSRCQFKCGKWSVLDCTNTGLDRLAGAELEKWTTSLAQCKIALFSLRLDLNSIGRLTQLPNLEGLEILSLKGNKISEIEPKTFLFLTKLKELDLSENLLTGDAVRPDIFIGPSKTDQYEPLSIEVLHLNKNKIHSLDAKTFEHLPNLRELYLHDNLALKVIDEPTVTAITSAPLLKVVSLSGCMLRKISFPKKSTLKKLFLNNNNISEIPKELPANLTYLNLNGNPISDLPSCAFCHLPRLEGLSLCGNPNLTSIGPQAFQGLFFLKTLQCDYNKNLEEIHPAAFADMTQTWTLREVSFSYCSLETIPRSLLPWNQLATLDLRGNPLSCDAEDWSPDAVKLLQWSEKSFGLLEEQESCNSWHLEASRSYVSLGTVAQTFLLAALSVVFVIIFATIFLVLSVRKAQAELTSSPNLMVHYRRATSNSSLF